MWFVTKTVGTPLERAAACIEKLRTEQMTLQVQSATRMQLLRDTIATAQLEYNEACEDSHILSLVTSAFKG